MVVDIVDGNSEPKISILVHSILVEDIGWLDISMQEASFVNIVISCDKLPHDLYSLEVRDGFALFDQPIEIPFAELSDEIGVVTRGIDIVKMEDMLGMS